MQRFRSTWEKPDQYHATYGDWTVARYIVGGEDQFVVWIGRISRSKMPNMVPMTFRQAVDAAHWIRWVEDQSREYNGDRNEIALTREQREIL